MYTCVSTTGTIPVANMVDSGQRIRANENSKNALEARRVVAYEVVILRVDVFIMHLTSFIR